MGYSEIFELRRQIHELRTNAAIMETALRAYEDIIEERDEQIEELLDHAGKAHDTQLKLYVWSDFCNGYTNGLAFAIAETENEARLLVMDETGYNGYRVISWGKVEVAPISKCARYVYGGD